MEEGEPRVPKTRINEMLARCDAAKAAALRKRPGSAVDKADDAPGPARMHLHKRSAFCSGELGSVQDCSSQDGSAQDCSLKYAAEQLGLASDLSDPLAFEKEKLVLEQAKLPVEREKLALDKAKLALKADEFAQELAQRKERFAQELAQRKHLDELELDKKDTELRTEWFYQQI